MLICLFQTHWFYLQGTKTHFSAQKNRMTFFLYETFAFHHMFEHALLFELVVNSISNVIFYHFSLKHFAKKRKLWKIQKSINIQLNFLHAAAPLVWWTRKHTIRETTLTGLLIQQNCVHRSCSCHCQLWGAQLRCTFSIFSIFTLTKLAFFPSFIDTEAESIVNYLLWHEKCV